MQFNPTTATATCLACGAPFTYLRKGPKPRTFCDQCPQSKRRSEYHREWYKANREAQQVQRRLHYLRNRDAINAKNRAYHLANKEVLARNHHAWYLANKAKVLARESAWYQANKDRVRTVTQNWRDANRDQYRATNANRYAATKGGEGRLTHAQWTAIKAAYRNRCVYCGKPSKRLTQDHVIPLIKGGGHTAANVVPACLPCNAGKRDREPVKIPPIRLLL